MPLADLLGWLAAALMVSTFACREPVRMRPLAVATNLAFIGYGMAAGLPPVLALHALLLPINVWHWWRAGRTSTPQGMDKPRGAAPQCARDRPHAGLP